jgi:hypothetical protein
MNWNERHFARRPIIANTYGEDHIASTHEEKSNKMQKYIKILLFHIYENLNMFRTTYLPSSGA